MADDPLKPVREAKAYIEVVRKGRQNVQLDFRAPIALESIAESSMLIAAELTVIRNLLAIIAAPKAPGR